MMELIISIGGTVIGGLVLALIFFLFSDFFFKLPVLSGLWRFESEIESTSYNPYRGMKVTYLVLLWQEGQALHGSGEKVKEDVKGSVRTYTGEHRSRIEVRGHLTRHFFRKSKVVLHYDEHGERRQSSTMQTLRIVSNDAMDGTFNSTIANTSGMASWVRGADGLNFEGPV